MPGGVIIQLYIMLRRKKWAEDEFSKMVEEEDKFRSNQIEKFKATYQVNAGNFSVEIDKKGKSTIFKCEIYVKFGTWYDFHWFLRPLGLDFIDELKSYEELAEKERRNLTSLPKYYPFDKDIS